MKETMKKVCKMVWVALMAAGMAGIGSAEMAAQTGGRRNVEYVAPEQLKARAAWVEQNLLDRPTGGQFPPAAKPETNIATHPEAARLVAAEWPTEIVWQGFEVGNSVNTGEALKRTPACNPVRRAFELRLFGKRPSIEGGQPGYDQAAAFYAVRGTNPELWSEERGGRVVIDQTGFSRWVADAASPHVMVTRVCAPDLLARQIEALMVAPPKNPTKGESK